MIRMVTGFPSMDAGKYFRRLGDNLETKCPQLKITFFNISNRLGSIEIIYALPGKAANYFNTWPRVGPKYRPSLLNIGQNIGQVG